VQDRVVSPVAGEVPGVYLHAMALDNLIVERGHFAHHAGPFGKFLQVILEALLAAALAIALPRLVACLLYRFSRSTRESALFRFCGYFAVLLSLILTAFLIAEAIMLFLGRINLAIDPIYIALATTIVLLEELRHEFFPQP
jgi:hypothetical protein